MPIVSDLDTAGGGAGAVVQTETWHADASSIDGEPFDGKAISR
jgi:hypothetical protein